MIPLLNFAQFLVNGLLELIVFAVIVYAILSWLIAFNVVNMRNKAVWQVSRFLEAVVRPILRPFQRVIPNLGGMDLSPILLFLVIRGAQMYLIPPFFSFLRTLVGGSII